MKEHPEFSERIPDNAQLILLLEGDEEFNRWSIRIGKGQAEKKSTSCLCDDKEAWSGSFEDRRPGTRSRIDSIKSLNAKVC